MNNGYCEKHERPYQFFCICGDWRYECPQCRYEGVYDTVATTQTKMNPTNEWTASDKVEGRETNTVEELIVMRSKGGDGTIYRQRPLVRCKDCKRYYANGGNCDQVLAEWFCADGKRKEGR